MSATKNDHIIYLDFDGTLTGAPGQDVINTELCNNLAYADNPEKRALFKTMYLNSETRIKITHDAKKFLNEMNKLHPNLHVVIVSRNHENYIRALLEFEGINTRNMIFYPRGKGGLLGPGENKYKAVKNHEKGFKPGFRLICDDFAADLGEMKKGARREGNIIAAHNAEPGMFIWSDFLQQIKEVLAH